ncbi:MAG: pyruvate kinase [Armatimonadota bacterium]
MARTKIVCTLGPASESLDVLRAMVGAGMRVARINCSHGTPEEHAERVELVRQVARETGVVLSVLYDLSGPKIRTGLMPEPVQVEAGKEFTLTAREDVAPGEVPLGFKELLEFIKPGSRILFDDGAVAADVVSVAGTDIVARALNSGPIGQHKGINLPGESLPIPAVTEKDMEDLRRGLRTGADWIALSFVRSAADIEPVRQIMEEMGIHRPVIAKIEKHEAITNLEEIIAAFDGVMVARGDLGVEVSLEQIPLLQKRIIRLANQFGKPVITATQMLDSMIRNPRPTRAEVTDIANAILDGTDAVMLSGETAVGKYPVETVRTMATVAEYAETLLPKDVVPAKEAPEFDHPTGALAAAAVDIAEHLGATAIIAATMQGHTANLVAKSRPRQPVIAATMQPETLTQLPLIWGVTPFLGTENETTDQMVDRAVRHAASAGIVQDGDIVVIVSVTPQPVGVVTRASNILRIAHVRQHA